LLLLTTYYLIGAKYNRTRHFKSQHTQNAY
jgi:hypothetical protein